ncbi:MAG: NAD(P)/FAD-dependent oxidoreductase [Bacteroides sp.]|nr:NAD(P)/FAD-dependent oxidoreductase [Bacillota bacterium]MCM1394277.1 NAD(P)/FAD-dependent oxidoreductase [[Eubacterium] siraeum]MCM1456209.1 NAD(P)/FAD-dependent oxidoreductase [Bacteroides sp.]
MAKIAVVGMGQGGMVAAIKLAKNGHDVTVYEQAARGEVSYDWTDDIRSDVFGICGLPMPNEDVYFQKCKWVFVSPNEKHRLPVPPCPPMEEISVYRRKLSEYFATQAENVGCNLIFNKRIERLVVENDAVIGVEVDDEKRLYDLVIDASGMCSKFRAQLPKKFGVQSQPKNDGIMYGYRAFFKKVEGAETVEKGIDSTVILKQLGSEGIGWCNLLNDGTVDVLIGRIGRLDEAEKDKALADLKNYNPILSDELISEHRVKICVRASMARAVADGYVAIGDSAFMTMPIMGSGIEAAMKAGSMFADFVVEENPSEFTAVSMWKFYVNYMRELGAGFAFIDVIKRWALALKAKRIDWLFGSGVISKEDLSFVSTEGGGKLKVRAKSVLLILLHPIFMCSAIKQLTKALRAQKCAEKIPSAYDFKKVAKWQKKYDKYVGA